MAPSVIAALTDKRLEYRLLQKLTFYGHTRQELCRKLLKPGWCFRGSDLPRVSAALQRLQAQGRATCDRQRWRMATLGEMAQRLLPENCS